ncbi:MAG: hypothetical protein AMXMBFR57_34600 [Acidimicrobiia bacterium]|jgi:uncharacterized protein (DUF2267 family)
MAEITPAQARKLVELIQRDFDKVSEKYDTRKYPPGVLRLLRDRMSTGRAEAAAMELAVMWKYGHLGKPNYPASHKQLADRLWRQWQKAPLVRGPKQAEVFGAWQRAFPTAFVTVCFLQHLVEPARTPILDRFNLKAVAHLLDQVGNDTRVNKAPRSLSDLEAVRTCISTVRRHWKSVTRETAPSFDKMDRYLMMKGKELAEGDRRTVTT